MPAGAGWEPSNLGICAVGCIIAARRVRHSGKNANQHCLPKAALNGGGLVRGGCVLAGYFLAKESLWSATVEGMTSGPVAFLIIVRIFNKRFFYSRFDVFYLKIIFLS